MIKIICRYDRLRTAWLTVDLRGYVIDGQLSNIFSLSRYWGGGVDPPAIVGGDRIKGVLAVPFNVGRVKNSKSVGNVP